MKTGDKVKVIKIINKDAAGHLENTIGKIGVVVSWVIYQNIKRYKVQFQDGITMETHYYREDELEG